MRINKPIIDNEVEIPPGQTLVTKTDTKGTINYINNAFIDVAGYSEEELMGQPHNVIRHPDVPSEAFRDLWETIEKGKTWSAPVKNRCKDGSYYWVMSNVSPIYNEKGEIYEYVSVRRGLTKEEKDEALELYAKIRSGEVKLHNGRVIKNIFSKISGYFFGVKVGYKIGVSALLSFLVSLSLCYILLGNKNQSIEKIEQQQAGLAQIKGLRDVLQFIPQHRGLTNGYLNGSTEFKSKILARREIINKNFITALNIAKDTDNAFGSTAKIQSLYDEWKDIESVAFKLEAPDSFARHTRLISQFINLTLIIADKSKLSLADTVDDKYLLDALVIHIPFITEEMGKARGLGAGLVSAKKVNQLQL